MLYSRRNFNHQRDATGTVIKRVCHLHVIQSVFFLPLLILHNLAFGLPLLLLLSASVPLALSLLVLDTRERERIPTARCTTWPTSRFMRRRASRSPASSESMPFTLAAHASRLVCTVRAADVTASAELDEPTACRRSATETARFRRLNGSLALPTGSDECGVVQAAGASCVVPPYDVAGLLGPPEEFAGPVDGRHVVCKKDKLSTYF